MQCKDLDLSFQEHELFMHVRLVLLDLVHIINNTKVTDAKQGLNVFYIR